MSKDWNGLPDREARNFAVRIGYAKFADECNQLVNEIAGAALSAVKSSPGEPVAWFIADDNGEVYRATGYEHERDQWRAVGHEVHPLYTAPLPASANRLTDEQILAIAWKYHYDEPDASGYDFGTPSLLEFARAIIAATEAK